MKTTHYIEMKVNVPAEVTPILHERRVIATADLLDLIASALHRKAAEFRVAGDETPLLVQGEALPMTILHRLGIEVEDPPYTDKRSELITLAARATAEIDEDELEEGQLPVLPKCPECNGTGSRRARDPGLAGRPPCSRCEGTGRLFASAPFNPPETT